MGGHSLNHPQSLSVEHADDGHYLDMLKDLEKALWQKRVLAAGLPVEACAICEDTGHHAGTCHHNPLTLALIGRETLTGTVYRCFHCRAVFTDDDSARNHFGATVDTVARCQRRRRK